MGNTEGSLSRFDAEKNFEEVRSSTERSWDFSSPKPLKKEISNSQKSAKEVKGWLKWEKPNFRKFLRKDTLYKAWGQFQERLVKEKIQFKFHLKQIRIVVS